MNATPTLQLKPTWSDTELDRHILDMTVATGRTIAEEGRIVGKGMVQDIIDFTPPGSQGNTGQRAKQRGELAISRDLFRMGFDPVVIKGSRMVTVAFGHPITPVRVKQPLNPKFADPEGHHRERLASRHGGKVTRGGGTKGVKGGAQAFYVAKAQLTSLRSRLVKNVGELAAGWIPAALELGVRVPAFIARHAPRGTVHVDTTNGIRITAVNHFPNGTDDLAADVQRRADYVKGYAIGKLKRQLQAKLKGLWGRR